MILPTKYLSTERSLLGIGADILAQLEADRTVSELWSRMQNNRKESDAPLSFDWFVLSLTFLYSIHAIHYERGVIFKVGSR